jgi:nucleoside-diphosphate-sugar epimerase
MTRSRIMVVGANGELGQAALRELGPEIAIAATRTSNAPIAGYEHVRLSPDGAPPLAALERCVAIINAAGKVKAEASALHEANVDLPQTLARSAKAAGVGKMVQVSSFSVFGPVEHIDNATEENPASDYGRSKAAADRALAALADGSFAIESVRLPFMFSATKPALLAPLLSLVQVARFLPDVKAAPIRRSMISYADAARILADCANDGRSGISIAADPLLFDYALLARILADEAGFNFHTLPIPGALAKAVIKTIPAIGRRLLLSSVLSAEANRAGKHPLGLEAELRNLVRNRYKRSKTAGNRPI